MTQIVIRPAAAADIDQAFLWYERQRPGLGEEFLRAVRAALDQVATHPMMYRVLHRNTRRVLLQRFPYGVCYRIDGELIIVVACMHGRRNPRRWKSRT